MWILNKTLLASDCMEAATKRTLNHALALEFNDLIDHSTSEGANLQKTGQLSSVGRRGLMLCYV